jgi:hypothetical protein
MECEVLISTQKVHGALSKEEGRTKEFPSWHVHLLKTCGTGPSYMATKKALYKRQPGSFAFCFLFVVSI